MYENNKKKERNNLITVVSWLEWTFDWDAEVCGLVAGELGEFDVEFVQVSGGDGFVELLWEHVDTEWVGGGVVPQFHLGQDLVGE